MKTEILIVLILLVCVACGRIENSEVIHGGELPVQPLGSALDGGDVIRNGDSTDFGFDSFSPYSDFNFDALKQQLNDQKALRQYRGFKERNGGDRFI